MLAIKEAKAMEGTEFTYIYSDEDSIRSYIKKFDPEIGLTALTIEIATKNGWVSPGKKESDGTWCVLGSDFSYPSHTLENALKVLDIIKTTGSYKAGSSGTDLVGSGVSCAF